MLLLPIKLAPSSVVSVCVCGMMLCFFAAFGNTFRDTRMIQTSRQEWDSLRSMMKLSEVGSDEVVSYQDAIVYLTGKDIYRSNRKNCPSLLHSLSSLARHFPVPNPQSLPVVMILSDVDLDNTTQAKIVQASPFPVQFHMDVPFDKMEDEPDVISGSEFDVSYKRMCAFWFKYFFELEYLPMYVMRMDTDSCISSDIQKNPFDLMRERNLDYMWHSTFHEPANVIVELKNFTLAHPGNPVTDHENDVSLLWEDKANGEGNMRVFSTNLEWFHMPAFHKPEVLEWKQQVMASNGIYKYRWGDAPLRTVVATRFFNTSAVARFCDFSYHHSVWTEFKPCHPGNDIHSFPGRKGRKDLGNGTTVESTFGW